jgi:hypothetical protein
LDNRAKAAVAAFTSAVTLAWCCHAQVSAATPKPNAVHAPLAYATVKPGAGLSLKIAAFEVKTGVQVNVQVTNVTVSTQRVEFPTSARISITATQNGCVLWSSLTDKLFIQSESSVIMQGGDIATFSEFWPIKPGSVIGPVVLHARLLSTVPKKAKSLVIDIPAPVLTPLPDGSTPKPLPLPAKLCATPLPTVTGSALPKGTPTSTASVNVTPKSAPTPEVMPAPGMRKVMP